MKRQFAVAPLAAIVIVAVGCGYLKAGTWEDDPRNWKRAFRSTKPEDVVVVHSKYGRSPHFTLEFEYFFQIASNPTLKEQLLTENELKQITGREADAAKSHFGEIPSWFAPKPLAGYDVWVYAEPSGGHFIVLIDKVNGTLFLADYQV